MLRTLLLTLALGTSLPAAAASGGRLNIEVKDAEVESVLQLIAAHARLNLVVDEEVKGQVTLRLRNVSWRTALKLVLRSQGLGQERVDGVLRVAPAEKLLAEKRRRIEAKKLAREGAEMETRFLRVSYTRASDLAPLVKATLTDRGTVAVDERTNTLIVRDVAAH